MHQESWLKFSKGIFCGRDVCRRQWAMEQPPPPPIHFYSFSPSKKRFTRLIAGVGVDRQTFQYNFSPPNAGRREFFTNNIILGWNERDDFVIACVFLASVSKLLTFILSKLVRAKASARCWNAHTSNLITRLGWILLAEWTFESKRWKTRHTLNANKSDFITENSIFVFTSLFFAKKIVPRFFRNGKLFYAKNKTED